MSRKEIKIRIKIRKRLNLWRQSRRIIICCRLKLNVKIIIIKWLWRVNWRRMRNK